MASIKENITTIRHSLPHDVTLLCVSKFQSISAIREAYDAGERDFGESRVQELMEKYQALPKDIRWHFIGHLQTNKVKYIVPFVYMIHSVDSIRLMDAIEREAERVQRKVNILLELHVAHEETKTGFLPAELPHNLSNYPYLHVCGVMGMATNTDDTEEWRRCFREIARSAQLLSPIEEQPIISMGMSGDYQVAIEEGSTLVRVGSSIFGQRDYSLPMSEIIKCLFVCLMMSLFSLTAMARTTRIYGYVVDEKNVGIEMVNVYLADGVTGTTTNKNGYYSLSVPMEDTVFVTYSMLGYVTIRQQLYTDRDVLNVNVVLAEQTALLESVEVRGLRKQSDMMDRTDAEVVRLMPDATGGSIESLLVTFAGVNQNNELSTQYNVRGGSFDENSVYVNGMEIHRPLLLRSGQQEGLSFVNPDMVEMVQFSAGGFDARYGDKMSSVLDIQYKRPRRLESSVSLSLLGANAYVGWGDSLRTQMHGIRYKTSKYMLGALPTKGNYQPNFLDYQTQMTWGLPKPSLHDGRWEVGVMGNVSLNNYRFSPDSVSEGWGGMTQSVNKTIWYEGMEKDRFLTAFGAFTAKGVHPLENSTLETSFSLNGFYTNENETYDIFGEYVLSEQDLSGTSSGPSKPGDVLTGGGTDVNVLGTGNSHEHARNCLKAGVVAITYDGQWKKRSNTLLWGVKEQTEIISDRISEWEWRDSAGYSVPDDGTHMNLFYTLRGDTKMQSVRTEAYLQDVYRWNTDGGKVTLTGGARLNWWSFTQECLVSPRVNVVWMPGWKRDFTFRFATGLYYQSPFYKELRDTVTSFGVTRTILNDSIRAPRSVHGVVGMDYYFRAWGRPFKFTCELYGKYCDRMISYSVENVRVRYSGKNDSRSYTIGTDLKLYGELVPGVDSWVSLSLMRSRMHMENDVHNLGWFPTPQEQRWAMTIFFQDYIPRLPQYRLHLKLLFSEGLPFGYPRDERLRFLGRMPSYKRIDIGASRTFSAERDAFMRKPSAKHVSAWSIYFEVFNLVDWKNVNSYYWVSAADNQQWASPNYLTGRMYNLRITVDMK